mmetsp:Transcript_2229/g.6899  ORF Transcript_2229/g.6899 Transcript_2229/m.6899 type:complete len:91 (+) Transcript_2229:339-611(+)
MLVRTGKKKKKQASVAFPWPDSPHGLGRARQARSKVGAGHSARWGGAGVAGRYVGTARWSRKRRVKPPKFGKNEARFGRFSPARKVYGTC